MKEYPNFYENLKEATSRLQGTVVLYEDKPYYVTAITDHKPDGIFRMYLDPLDVMVSTNVPGIPLYSWDTSKFKSQGEAMDDWLDKNPTKGIIRKMMNSPAFNKFRPFDLGVAQNSRGELWYCERQPTRPAMSQGLAAGGINQRRVSLAPQDGRAPRSYGVELFSKEMSNCITGKYLDPKEIVWNLTSPDVTNEGFAFSRNFAILRGPLSTMFLSYKTDIVGVLPDRDLSKVMLSDKFTFVKEMLQDTGAFASVEVHKL